MSRAARGLVGTLAVIIITSQQLLWAVTAFSTESTAWQTPTRLMARQQFTPVVASTAAATTSFTDPFAYCAAVGTVDAPDSRYAGPRVPKAIARGLKQAFAAPPTAPLTPFLKNSFWRCMDGKVYACTVGANLPCQEKADTSRTPTSAMAEFCRDNAEADSIPAFVTGRATIYTWRCTGGTPAIVREVTQPDARGFLSTIWYKIPPP
ncbi:MAG: hypothetical protein HY268_27125 [Deltaproteobacteria bacterium]|nr:hypothetical protein [Deltaproteobacteria bacterium]